MKRTTVMLPDETLARLRHEAKLRGTAVAEIVRDAVERHLAEADRPRNRSLGFIAVGEGGPADASERVDEHVAAAIRRRSG
ncbi:MAG: ribbon-helix-helix protein, CopG family [Thermoleophilia bacterium]|nr:ribbon-helix-helix protein, CopG family [Thermoleophilia bacterium]